jgi:hypothetical protein
MDGAEHSDSPPTYLDLDAVPSRFDSVLAAAVDADHYRQPRQFDENLARSSHLEPISPNLCKTGIPRKSTSLSWNSCMAQKPSYFAGPQKYQ